MATQANSVVDATSTLARQHTAKRMEAENGIKNLMIDANAVRKPDYFVYVYTTCPRSFEVRQPNALPYVKIPACEASEKVKYVCKFPNVLNMMREDPDTQGKAEITGLYGENVAMSLCNPGNPTLNQDQEFSPGDPYQAENLTKYGVFWSLNAPDKLTDKEINHAREKMEKTFRGLIQEADNLAAMGPKGREQILEATHYVAAKYFAYEGIWNTVVQIPVACAICGGNMRKGAILHGGTDGCGGVQPGQWKKVVEAGLKKKEDVPDAERWWKEKEPKVI